MMVQEPFVRLGHRPLITPDDLPFEANAVLNPGAAEVDDQIVLLLRIEDRRGISSIYTARSANGVDRWEINPEPLLQADLPEYPYEEWGCEDARVTPIGENIWLIAYCAYSRYGPSVALATTKDFETVDRLGVVLPPVNKDATIFPEKFDDHWMLLHRPVTGAQEHIWYARGHDFAHWSEPGVLLVERSGPWWDGLRIGCGAPPIKTDNGWLIIYHGAKEMGGRPIYRLGAAMLDLHDPRKLLARASEWIFAPKADYEQRGLVPSVVFTCGAIRRDDQLWMYYGAADTVIGLAVARTNSLVDFVQEHDYIRKIGPSKGMIC